MYGYRGMIKNYLKPELGEIRLQKLTARDIQRYYTWLMDEKRLSPNTIIKHHNLLTNALNAAERQEYITKNPMRAVSPPKKRQREAKFYTPEQLGVLLDKVAGTRLELPVYICAYLGLRRGELCGLRWSDIDLEHQTITIENTRTQTGKKEIEKGTKTVSSTRTLYLPDTLCEMLKTAKEREQECKSAYKNAYDDNDYVVVMEDGRPFRPNYLSELFGEFLADNDLPKIVLHELRHTFASLSNQAGIPAYNIGKALIDEIRVWDPMKFGTAMSTWRKFSRLENGWSRIRMRKHSAICCTRCFARPSAPARSGAHSRSAKR